jgi:hypothetical protein
LIESGSVRALPFKPADLPLLALQTSQRQWMGDDAKLDEAYGQELVEAGPCWTVTDMAGWPLAVLGFKLIHARYAVAWALLGRIGRHHLSLTRGVRRHMAGAGYARVEALIRADHPAGARWAGLVGLTRAFLVRAAGPEGEDFWLYERVVNRG